MRLLVALTTTLLLAFSGTAAAQELDPLVTGDLRGGIRLLEAAVRETDTTEEASHLRYLIGRSHQQGGDCRAAIAAFDQLEGDAERGDLWVSRARFGRSECLARMEQPGLALSAFFEEAERLIDPTRRQALAAELMDFAREDMTPDDDDVVPNAYRAQQIFGVVLTLDPDGDFADEAEHHRARLSNDVTTLQARLSRDPTGEWSCRDHAALAFAAQSVGWGAVPAQVHWYVATECSGTEARRAARAIADLEYSARSIHALDAVIPNIADVDVAQPMRRRLVQQLIQIGEIERARIELNAAIETSSGRDLDAVLLLAAAFVSTGHFDDARELWTVGESLTTRSSIRDRIAAEWTATRRSEAEEARRAGELAGAIAYLGLLEEEVPREQAAARELTGRLLAEAGRAEEAISVLMTAETNTAARAAVEVLELEGRMGEALLIRQEFGLGLPTETLEVAALRTFQTTEAPELLVRTTGLNEVELRFHAIDVEDHLRSIGTLAGIGNLDVDLIAPESTRVVELNATTDTGEGAAATYGPVPLGRLESGVHAVEVVGEAQQASALVRVSDLDLTVRLVAGDFAVLVVNTRTGRVVRGADIVVTDGSQVVDEGRTDANGLYRGHNTSSSLEVLAVSAEGSAWATVLAGGGDAVSLRNLEDTRRPVRARLDRSEATPGETVRVYATIAQGELPRVLPSEEVAVQFRIGGEVLDEWSARLEFGVLDTEYTLADDLPSGSYSFVFEGQFLPLTVGRQSPHVGVSRLQQLRPVAPGEDAPFRITRYGVAGEPVVGAPVFGNLDDGQGVRLLGHTDENGALDFVAPTSDLRRVQSISASDRYARIELTPAAGLLNVSLDEPEAGVPATLEISWPDASASTASVRILRNPNGLDDTPALSRVAPLIGNPAHRLVFTETLQLNSEDGSIQLPGLSAGSYTLTVEIVDDGHQFASRVQRFVVREPGVRPRLVGLENDRVAPLSTHELEVSADSTLPMLATLEGVGILDARALRADERWPVELPPELTGEGAVALSHVGESSIRIPTHTMPFTVVRDLEVELSAGPELRMVSVAVMDSAGNPVAADVFVSVQPTLFEPTNSSVGFFARTIARLPGTSASSAPWTHRGQTSAIDLDVLAWQQEQYFETMAGAPYELADTEMPRDSRVSADGFGRGAGGLGAIGYGQSASGIVNTSVSLAVGPQLAGFVSPRRAPAAWSMTRTDANGRATVDVDHEALSRGWYTISATVIESAAIPRTDTRAVLGDAFETTGVWVNRDSAPDAVAPRGAIGATRVFTRILAPGEALELETAGASSASVRVSAPGVSEVIRTLLTPDGVANGDGAFWREQTQVYASLALASPDSETRRRRWIAARGAALNGSGTPARFQSTNTLLSRLETLAEDQVAARARTILAIARQTPANSQAQAALMHLGRSAAVQNPDAVGAFALASLLMVPDFDISTLVEVLEYSSADGDVETRALSLEALALSGRQTGVDAAALLATIASGTEMRRARGSEGAIGSLLRALIHQNDARLVADGSVSVGIGSLGEWDQAPDSTTSFSISSSDDRLILRATDRPVAVRVEIGDVHDPGSLDLTLEAVRHGPWFEGTEILPVDVSEVDTARDATVGRQLVIRGRISGASNRSISLSAFAPPGTQLVPGSVTGLSEVWTEGREIFLRGTAGREFSFRVQVVGPAENDTNWEPAVLTSIDGAVLAVVNPGTLSIRSAAVENTLRLARQPVLQTGQDLIQDERLSLGVALEATAATASVLADERARQAMELLLPLLQSADLNQSQVQATGAASFRAALALEDDEAIRSLFGVLESRAPRAPISESELLQVARTFSRAGDLEYARRAWNAVLNLRFLAEVGAGEQLVDLGMPAEGLRLVHDLTTAYPDIPSVTESVFNLPQMLVRQAEAQPDNPEGRFTGRRFRRTADRWLSEYLIRYGDEERASQAALQQMHIASELEEWGRLITLGPAFRRMYDDSNLADSFDFMTAYGHQREGDYASARRLYERIAEEMYGTQWSSDRDRARLALAQIAHAEGDLGAAIESYRAAGNGFPDARAALTVLESAELRVPAVVDAATGRGLTIPIRVRAVDSVEVWAYAVDLERLFLRENQVRAVENILLSGIPPIVEESFDLPMNFGALAEHEISLPLREAGAYLVLVRSETTLASTLAIVSDLQLDIVEDPRANALHIGVTDRNGQPLEGATVRVAYPGGTPMTAETDLRGLVAHNGFNATAHVLARAGEQYAVYRGGEDSGFDAPSQINTGWGHAPAPASLMEGQQMRMQEVQESNIIEYEQNVFRNRRSISNFDLE